METKICRICRTAKPLADFGLNRSQKDNKHYWCRPCALEYGRTRAGRRGPNPGTHNSEMPDYLRAQRIVAQNGCCALCDEETGKFAADHDHSTGAFRSMLCYSCNLRLSKLERELEWYQRAIDYVATDWVSVAAGSGT